MSIFFYNTAGVACNIINYLKWCLQEKNKSKVIFYYNDKFYEEGIPSDHFQNIDFNHNIFYKLFNVPEDYTIDDFKNFKHITRTIEELHLNEIYPDYFESAYGVEIGAMNKDLFLDSNKEKLKKVAILFNDIIKERLIMSEVLKERIQTDHSKFFEVKRSGKKILAVMIRCALHYYKNTSDEMQFDSMLNQLEEKMAGYDYILPITIVEPFYNAIQNKFGERCIPLERKRTKVNEDWTVKFNAGDDLSEELYTTFADIYLASQSDYVLGSNSSMFMLALFLNPTMNYDVINVLKGLKGA